MSFTLSLDPDTFSSLKSRSFRIFLAGQSVALTGLWMQKMANSWLVYRVTQSAFRLGLIELVSNAPIFIVGFLAGAWLDRHDIRKTLITTQILTMVHAAVMACLLLLNCVQFWHILILSFYLGLVNAVDLPARQSSILLMVENKRQLKSALALHSMVFNLSRLLGPSAAGFIIYYTGEAFCFLFTAICYVPVIFALFIIKFRKRKKEAKKQNPLKGSIEGLEYVARSFPLKRVLGFLAIFSAFSYSYTVMFPIFARDVLAGNSKLLGFLLGGVGFGAVFGAFSLASFVKLRRLPLAIGTASLAYIFFISLFALSPFPALSIALTIPAGFGLVSTFVATNTLIQSVAEDDKRSRVVSLYTICNVGLGPVGAFIAGIMAEALNARYALLLCAGIMLGASAFLWLGMKRINRELTPVFNDLEKS